MKVETKKKVVVFLIGSSVKGIIQSCCRPINMFDEHWEAIEYLEKYGSAVEKYLITEGDYCTVIDNSK